jgi:hypothetical protein
VQPGISFIFSPFLKTNLKAIGPISYFFYSGVAVKGGIGGTLYTIL